MTEPYALETRVRQFAEDVLSRVLMCLEGEPRPDVLTIEASPDGRRFTFSYRQTLHATPGGPTIGMLQLDYALGTDRSGQHLAVHVSTFQLRDSRGKKPIVRVEYIRDAQSVPCSHIHVHAESGLFTQLLAATGHDSPAAVQSIHIPTGGDRFRPCVEDFIEFLISECRVAGREGWREEIKNGRELWRAMQTAAAVRDRPEAAVAELQRLGLEVTGELPADRPSARDRF
ncbi:hypothetical protein Mycch_2212 [Mycolicibacterium chubuense NBB4]|uniref:Uncharacterized protein n=1 Tax=Mycolicibacterium chubuense (strain NBB4) TaxID=710421 RepID=I4BI88_MYCCN|nr:hypothetical protein [Mycolicibacterium chubuense]AFM16995.1 hypothetical protein Mycch_2212 [Mycolicibacterium chubuense NBB4]